MPLGLSQAEFIPVEAKTASYAMTGRDHGKLFTNEGASGSVTFTLPPVTSPTLPPGWYCRVFVAADQTVTVVSAGSLDNLYAFNDVAADSIAFSTSSEKVGSGILLIWTGTGWCPFVSLGA